MDINRKLDELNGAVMTAPDSLVESIGFDCREELLLEDGCMNTYCLAAPEDTVPGYGECTGEMEGYINTYFNFYTFTNAEIFCIFLADDDHESSWSYRLTEEQIKVLFAKMREEYACLRRAV